MAENKQNSENKTMTSGAASTGQAKDASAAPSKASNPTESSIGKSATPSGGGNASGDALNKAKETVGAVTNQAIGQAKEKVGSVLDEQKSSLASGITGVADSIRQVGENVGSSSENKQIAALAGKYGDSLAAQVEKFSDYVNEKEIRELIRDVDQFARRNPLLFVGGAFALGVLAARFLKSSGGQTSGSRGRNVRSGNYSASENKQSGGR